MKKLLLLIGVSVLFSCTSDDNSSPNPTLSQMRIKEVKMDGNIFETYEYDSDHRVTNYTQYKNNRPEFVYNYKYQNDTTYTKVILSGVYVRDEKSFQLDELNVRKEAYVNDHFSSAHEYTWDENSCSYVTMIIYWVNSGDSVIHCVFEGDNCNEKRRGLTSFGSRFALDIYRDGMKAYDAAAVPPPMEEAPGNPVTYIDYEDTYTFSTEEDLKIIPELSYDSEFTYNDAGYPISETRTYRNGKVHDLLYEYY